MGDEPRVPELGGELPRQDLKGQPGIPEMGGGRPPGGLSAALSWARRNKGLIGAGFGAFIAVAFVGILLLPPLEEDAPQAAAAAQMMTEMQKWKAPKIDRGDPAALIRGADLMAGVDGGKPLDSAPAPDEDDAAAAASGAGQGAEGDAGVTGGSDPGGGSGRKLSSKALAGLKKEDRLSGGSRRSGGSSASGSSASLVASSRQGLGGRGPLSVARRRVSAALRRLSRAGGNAMAGLRKAFGGAGAAKPYSASGGAPTFAASPGSGDGTAAAGAGGAIGGMGGAGTDSGSAGGAGPLAAISGAGPSKEVKPSGKSDPIKCKMLKTVLEDFWPAYEEIRNINKRYHSTETPDLDLTTPLMALSAVKYAELDKVNGQMLSKLNPIDLSCKGCTKLDECRTFAQLSIGTGNGSGIAREIQDVVRATQKGQGVCQRPGYDSEKESGECLEYGLEAIDHDRKAKTLVEQHLVLLNAKLPECKADEAVGTASDQQKAKKANQEWNAYVQADRAAYQKMYDYLKDPWCSEGHPKCKPVRLGKMRDAFQRLGKILDSSQVLSEYLVGEVDFIGRLSEARSAMQQAIKYHEAVYSEMSDDGRKVFLGVAAEDKAARAVDGLEELADAAMQKCGQTH